MSHTFPKRTRQLIAAVLLLLGLSSISDSTVRSNPNVQTSYYIKSDLKTLDQTCEKNDPCHFFKAWGLASNYDNLIFQQGTYTMADMGYEITDPRTELISSGGKSLNLYGGWDGEGTLGIDPVINPSIYPAVLDGEDVNRIVTITGLYNATLIDGFTMINGYGEYADNTKCYSSYGGVKACGGAIYVADGAPRIQHNIIHDNVALNRGTDMGLGGGIYANSPTIRITDNFIYSNSGSTLLRGRGGGIYLYGGNNVVISNNIIGLNEAGPSPEAGPTAGAGIFMDGVTSVQISDNWIIQNNSFDNPNLKGSALYSYNSTFDLVDNVLSNNGWSSVVYMSDSKADIERNFFYNPTAVTGVEISRGASIGASFIFNNFFMEHPYYHIQISGDDEESANVNAQFNTIVNTTVNNSKGYLIMDYVDGSFGNSIIVRQKDGFYDSGHSHGTITIDYNLMYGNTSNCPVAFTCSHTFIGDPLFVNPASNNYHILPGSAAYNRSPGVWFVTDDYDLQRRPYASGDLNDLGADEIVYPAYISLILK